MPQVEDAVTREIDLNGAPHIDRGQVTGVRDGIVEVTYPNDLTPQRIPEHELTPDGDGGWIWRGQIAIPNA